MTSTARMLCCFCYQSTRDAEPGEYVVLHLDFPEVKGSIEQAFGAHRTCLVRGIDPTFTVEGPM